MTVSEPGRSSFLMATPGPFPRTAASMLAVSLVMSWVGCAEPQQPPPAAPPIQTRKTVGKTTQNVLELSQALAAGGVLAETSVTSGGIEAVADSYRTSTGRIGTLAVDQKMRLHEAEHGRKPATHAEFMARIIAPGTPDSVTLPMLPYYQEWAYDPDAKAVVVVEFPARKEQRQQETTGATGL